MKIPYFRAWLGASLLSVLLAACGGDEADTPSSRATGSAAAGADSTLLAYVPDDTPYFVANRERMPDEILDLLWEMARPGLSYFDKMIAAKLEEGADDPLQRAVLEELKGKMNRAGMAELGLEPVGNMAVYGIGVLPVMRVEVADSDRLSATIARIEQKSGKAFPRNTWEGVEYYEVGDQDGTVAISIAGNQVLLGLMPTSAKAAALGRVLGTEKPARSLADSGRLDSLNDEFDLTPYGTLLIDTERLVQAVVSDQSELARAMFAEQQGQLSAACRAEFQEMARLIPRVVSGYRTLSNRAIDQLMVVELRSDVASGLRGLTVPMAGMGSDSDGMFNFGLALDILKTKQFLTTQANAVAQDPYECEHLAELNQGMQEMSAQLATPLPPMVGNVQGVRVNLKNVDMSMGMPSDMRLLAMVGMTNPQLVVGMAGAFVPQLASLQLGTDGEPVPLPADALPFPVESPHVAMMNHGIAFSVGAGEQANLKAFLNGKVPDPAPFMTLGYDMRAMQLYQQQVAQALAAAEDQGTPVEMPGISDKLDRVGVRVDFTGRGVEMRSDTRLKP